MEERLQEAISETVQQIEVADRLTDFEQKRAGIAAALEALANHTDLFSAVDFPRPTEDGTGRRYVLHERADGRLPLYLSILKGPIETPIHDHKVWAGVASISGLSTNRIYAPVAEAAPVETQIVPVDTGESLVTEPAAIHSVSVEPGHVCVNLLTYAVALDRIAGTGPEAYDPESGDKSAYWGG